MTGPSHLPAVHPTRDPEHPPSPNPRMPRGKSPRMTLVNISHDSFLQFPLKGKQRASPVTRRPPPPQPQPPPRRPAPVPPGQRHLCQLRSPAQQLPPTAKMAARAALMASQEPWVVTSPQRAGSGERRAGALTRRRRRRRHGGARGPLQGQVSCGVGAARGGGGVGSPRGPAAGVRSVRGDARKSGGCVVPTLGAGSGGVDVKFRRSKGRAERQRSRCRTAAGRPGRRCREESPSGQAARAGPLLRRARLPGGPGPEWSAVGWSERASASFPSVPAGKPRAQSASMRRHRGPLLGASPVGSGRHQGGPGREAEPLAGSSHVTPHVSGGSCKPGAWKPERRAGEGRGLKQAGVQTGGEAGPAVQMEVRWPGPAERAGPGPAGDCRNDGGLGRGRNELGCGGGRLHLRRKLPRAGGALGLYPELASHRQQGAPEAGLSAGEPGMTALLPCLRTCCGSPLQPGVLCVVGTNTRLTALLREEMTVRRAISNLLHPRRCLGTPQGQGPLELTSGGAPSPELGTETEE